MFRHHADEAGNLVFLRWFELAFLAGSVNAGGFMACERFVSHVTGFATLFGHQAAHRNWDQAIGILSVPAFFLLGVMVSGLLVDRPAQAGRRPHYAAVMALVGTCNLIVALAGELGWFGVFGAPLRLRHDYVLLALLCGASGLQNAAISTASGRSVRTTHLTGITTDLGTGIIRSFYLDRESPLRARELRATQLRLGTIVSFALGSLVGAFVYLRVGYLGFLLPAGIAYSLMAVSLRGYGRLFLRRVNGERIGLDG